MSDGCRAGRKIKAMAGHDGFPSVLEREKQEWKFDGQWKLRYPSRGCVMGWPCKTSLFSTSIILRIWRSEAQHIRFFILMLDEL